MFIHLPIDIINHIISYLLSYERRNVKWTCKTLLKEIIIAKSVVENEIKCYMYPMDDTMWVLSQNVENVGKWHYHCKLLNGFYECESTNFTTKCDISCDIDMNFELDRYVLCIFNRNVCDFNMYCYVENTMVNSFNNIHLFNTHEKNDFVVYGGLELNVKTTKVKFVLHNVLSIPKILIVPIKHATNVDSLFNLSSIGTYIDTYFNNNKWNLLIKNVFNMHNFMGDISIGYECDFHENWAKLNFTWLNSRIVFKFYNMFDNSDVCNVFFDEYVFILGKIAGCDYSFQLRVDKLKMTLVVIFLFFKAYETQNTLFTSFSPWNPLNYPKIRTCRFKYIVDLVRRELTTNELVRKIKHKIRNYSLPNQMGIHLLLQKILAFST
jgi:hypothetical protein